MDSLRDGYRALVFGSSGGIGSAFLERLKRDKRCAEAIGFARTRAGAAGRRYSFDLEDETTLAEAAAELEGEFDLLIIATGALEIDGVGPEKAFKQIDPVAMARQFAVNAIGPALVLKHFGGRLPKGRRCLVGALSARVGSIGDNGYGGWMSYRASKAALNQILRCFSVQMTRTHKHLVVAALHPGTVRTPLTETFRGDRDVLEPEDSAQRLLNVLNGLNAEQTGTFWDYAGKPVEW